MACLRTIFFLLVFLVGCQNVDQITPPVPVQPNPDPIPEDTITQFGFIGLIENRAFGEPNSRLTSVESEFQVIEQETVSKYSKYQPRDRCTTTGSEDVSTTVSWIDAGETITLKQKEDSYISLVRNDDYYADGYIYYEPALLNDISSDLTLPPLPDTTLDVSIPGAVFPSFQDASLYIASELVLKNTHNLDRITLGTTLEWETAKQGPGISEISFVILQERQGELPLTVSCTAVDDGSFSFPEGARNMLQAEGFSTGPLLYITRMRTSYMVRPPAVLWLYSDRTIYFEASQY